VQNIPHRYLIKIQEQNNPSLSDFE